MVSSRAGNPWLVLGCPHMRKPARTTALAMGATALVLGLVWVGKARFGRSKEPTHTEEEDTSEPGVQQASSPPPSSSARKNSTQTATMAPAKTNALAFKVYRADLCFFAAARVRMLKAHADASPPSGAGDKRAIHACEMAASQSEPPTPALDQALAALVPLVRASAVPEAFDEEWRRLGRAIEERRAANPVQPSGGSESERLARAAFEHARAIVARIALESNPEWASEAWLQGERAQFKDSIVALARYGTQNAPDAWITIVEPALEALLRELQATPSGTDKGNANLMRVFLMLIEANQRATFSN